MAEAAGLTLVYLLCAGVAYTYGCMRTTRRFEREVTLLQANENQPAERHKSPAKYLYACSQRLGVSTQSLKDLGFTAVHQGEGVYTLEPAPLSPALEHVSREAMNEIAAECRVVGNRVRIPPTSYRWVARAAQEWETSIKEGVAAPDTQNRVAGTWE